MHRIHGKPITTFVYKCPWKVLQRTDLRLSHFVVVVWECEVYTTRMDVHAIPENGTRHHRALNMPAWAAWTPR
jgi:hypothetical protein